MFLCNLLTKQLQYSFCYSERDSWGHNTHYNNPFVLEKERDSWEHNTKPRASYEPLIFGDKTMDIHLNDDKQNYTMCISILLVEKFGTKQSKFNKSNQSF